MWCRWLGWAGVEVQSRGERLLIDPLVNPRALYVAVGERAASASMPELADPGDGAPAVAALITHLHRDHADADALAAALAPEAPVIVPEPFPGTDPAREPGLAQAHHELVSAGLALQHTAAWRSRTIGPFTVTALPAADGTGEPQVAWAVAADGQRILHLGDTVFHGWWWRMARAAGPFDAVFAPINGAVVSFPWNQPASSLPAAMTAEQAIVAARALGAARAIPMHFGGFDLEPFYRSAPDALPRFMAAAERDGVSASPLAVGGELDLAAAGQAR